MLISVGINKNITLHRMYINIDININITLHRLTLAGVLSRHGLLPKYNLDILMNDKVLELFLASVLKIEMVNLNPIINVN